jgi:hypothetical protein
MRRMSVLSITLALAETAPGATAHHHRPHFRLRAGVVDTPNGPYFIKLTGPEKTVSKWDRAYQQFIDSFQAK